MPTNSVFTLADAAAGEGPRASDALRSQAAFVRALADEVERHHPDDPALVPLREQLSDELGRLSELVPTRSSVPPPRGYLKQLEVLVVDDEPAALHALVVAVHCFGYSCQTARSGEEALRLYQVHPVDIVVCDWNMPGMTGLELTAALKCSSRPPYVILVTGHGDARMLDDVPNGPDDFLPKPLDLDDLEVRMKAASHLLCSMSALEGAVAESDMKLVEQPEG